MRRALATGVAALAVVVAPGLAAAQDRAGQEPRRATGEAIGQVSVAEAVRTAESTLSGRAIDAEQDTEDGRFIYEIDVLTGDGIEEVEVDGTTGEVISTDRKRLATAWRDLVDDESLAAVRQAPRSLGEILASLQTESGGLIHQAELEEDDGRIFYEIEMTRPGGERVELEVDIASGAVLSAERD